MLWQTILLLALWTGVKPIEIIKLSELGKVERAMVSSSMLTVRVEAERDLIGRSNRGYLLIYPYSNDPYEISAGQKGDMKLRCIGMKSSICVLNLHDEAGSLESIKGYEIEMVTKCRTDCSGSLGVAVADYISIDLLGSANIIMEDIDELKVEVQANTTSQSNKIRFHAGGYSKNHSIESMSLQVFGNKGKENWPDGTTHDFSLYHIHGHELSRVFYMGDKNFCDANTHCKYRFTMMTKDLWRVVFYAFDAGKYDRLSHSVTAPTTGLYSFELDQAKLKAGSKVYITLDSIEGNTKLYVNPAFLPEYSATSIYKAEQPGSKQITIKPEDLRRALRHDATIYTLFVMVTADSSASYFIKVNYQASSDAYVLDLNRPQSGFIETAKMRDFVVEFETISEDETRSLNIQLDSVSQKLFLFAQPCATTLNCGFFDDRIVQSLDFPNLDKVKRNQLSTSHKELDIELKCGKRDSFSTTKVSHKISLFKCVLNVGVYSNEEIGQNPLGTSFTVKVQDKSMHHLIPINEWTMHRLQSGEQLSLQVNILKLEAHPLQSLTFKFDSHFGQSDVLLSKKNRNPCDEKDLISRQTVQHNEQKTIIVDRNLSGDNKIVGNYYICVKSQGISSLSVLVETNLKDDDKFGKDPLLSKAPKLLPHNQIMGQIIKQDDILYFTIDADFDKDEKEIIQINVTPISGTFRIFATSSGVKPLPDQNYWNVVGSTLQIKPSDRAYLEKGRYIVGVKLASPVSGTNGQSNKFLISYESSEKHTLLRKGLPYVGTVNSLKNVKYFQIHFPKDANEITIFKSQLQAHVYALVSFNLSVTYPDFKHREDLIIHHFTSSVVIKKDKWQKNCPSNGAESVCKIFITVGSTGGEAHYSIVYSVDNSPLTLPQDFVFSLPVLESESNPLKLVYHANKSKTATLDIQPLFQHFNYFVKWEKEQTDSSKYDFPTQNLSPEVVAHGSSESQHEFIISNSGVNKTEENSVLLVTLYPIIHGSNPDLKNLGNEVVAGFNGFFEISSGYRTLTEGKVITERCSHDEWKYYRLRHPYSTEDIFVNVEMISGAAQLYLSRGFDQPPSDAYHLLKRFDYHDSALQLSEDDLPPGTMMNGNYMVGIKCVSSLANFQVLYQSAHAKWLTVQVGHPVTHRIPANQYTFIELPSDALDGDLVLTYYSRYAHLTLLAIPRVYNISASLDEATVFPGPENYLWKSTQEGTKAGFGRLVIKPSDQGYCRMCSYVIRVETSEEDKVEFSAIKKNSHSFIRIFESNTYLGDLNKGEKDNYVMVVPTNETYFNINLRVLKGNVSLHYGVDPSFQDKLRTYTVPERHKNQFFTINFGRASSYLRKMTHTDLVRFIRLESHSDDSQYTFQVASDGLITELTTKDVQQAILSSGMTHYYYFPSALNESVELFFNLRYILDRDSPDFSSVIESLPRLIRVYQASTLQEVFSKSYSYEAESTLSLYKHEVQVSMKTKKGFIVVLVSGYISKSFSFTIELAKHGTKRLLPGVDRPDHVRTNMTNTYIIDSREDNDEAQVHVDMCLNSITAEYEVVGKMPSNSKNKDNVNGMAQGGKMTLINNMFMRRSIPIGEYSFLNLSVQKSKPEENSEFDSETEKYPSIYNIYHNIVSAGEESNESQGDFIVGDIKNYGEIEAFTDDDQSIKFEGLEFHKDFLRAHRDYSMLVNYTLYMSKDKRMLHFMKYCDYYRIDEASAAYNTDFYKSYSIQEYHPESLVNRNEPPVMSIQPHSFSFGGIYHGVVVAEVRLWPKTDLDTYPQAKVLRVFYNEFEFEPADFSIAMMFLLTFLIICTVAFILYLLIKNKILGKLRAIKFIDNIVSEFNEEDVGNNLVLEIIDYKRQKKTKTDLNAELMNTSQNESGVELSETLPEPSNPDSSPEKPQADN